MGKSSELSGRVAIVTGGSSGIGLAIACLLAERHAEVVIAGRKPQRLDDAARTIEERTGRPCLAVPTDVRDEAQVGALVAHTIERLGRVDILVNNAGGARRHAPLRKLSFEHWRSEFDLNVHAAFLCSQAVLPQMIERGAGAIVNLSSLAGMHGTMGVGAYAAAKAALQMYTRVAAAEWGPLGIRVNAVAPGMIATDLARTNWAKAGFDADAATSSFPLRRPGEASEAAEAVAFLASDAASYITGEVLAVAGGPQLKGMIEV